ncbi:hypothetical protein EYC98_01845 [Halieaceae bacterium IMCC14734]|uniref:Methyltransferase domain-containing protein n=1 Tax=Candidatus Litorirhabdus singularis TaxID=2518993 RepID=A0ABT3TBE0_9GAMM|nr:hypothetical protein [Candidatus Litorirhabdus singularis]MCX2979599.1 hypothetical protein [Candidatus Litorirhabdus singularis]
MNTTCPKKRAQLLSGFDFDPALKLLEVGCGCGAITLHLAENMEGGNELRKAPDMSAMVQQIYGEEAYQLVLEGCRRLTRIDC